MPKSTLAVTTIGHPDRDPDTGLVSEASAYDQAAGDDPEQAFGDGRSIVAVFVSAYTDGRIDTTCMVRPTEKDAPRSSNGRPMNGYLERGDMATHRTPHFAIDWLVERGITVEHASTLVARAVEARRRTDKANNAAEIMSDVAHRHHQKGLRAGDIVKLLNAISLMAGDAELTAAFDALRAAGADAGPAGIGDVRREFEQIASNENADRYRR